MTPLLNIYGISLLKNIKNKNLPITDFKTLFIIAVPFYKDESKII